MEKENKILKNILKRKIKMTTAVLVAFLISGSLSFASGGASGIGDVLDDQRHDLYLAPGEYTPDDDGNINMSLINRQDGNGEDMPDESIYNMSEEDFNKLSDHDKEILRNRKVTIKNVVNKDKMTGDVTSNTLTITNGTDRLYGDAELTVELKDDSVDTNHLKDNAVTGEKIQDGAVTEGKLGTDSVTEEKIKDGAVTENKLANDAVTENKIANNAVTENKIANNAVTENKIADNAVTENKIANNAVTENKIADNAVTENKIANNAVTENKIANNAVTENKIADNAVTENKIADNAVTENKIANNAVTENKIADNAVTENKIADNAVTENKINNGAVTTNKLGDNAVTTEKINNGAVTRDKLSDALKTEIDGKVNRTEFTGDITSNTITVTGGNDKLLGDVTLEVADGAITADKLANNAVTENKIADNAVTENKINNGAVSKDKLSDALKTEIDGKANKTEVYTKIDEVSITKDADGNGTVDVKGKDGKSGVSLNGKDGSIGINGKDGNSVSMTTEKGPKGIGKENEKPRMTYEFTNEKKNPDGTPVIDPATNKPVTETVKETLATMNDGLYFAGDNNATTISKKLNEKLEIVGGADRDKLTKNNIGVNANAEGKLEVQLSKELKGMRSAEFTDPNTGNIVKITGEGTTITNPKTGDTVIMNQGGITISKTDKDGKPNNVSLSREGLSNGGNKITNVAAGDISEGSTDVVNGRQLHQVQAQVDQNAQNIQNVNQKVDRLGERVNKGLAGAAAMSGIEFMEIGINQATVAAAVGGYRGTHAVAVGVQAAPTENTRVNAKMSLTPGSRTEVMYSVGAAYRFNLK